MTGVGVVGAWLLAGALAWAGGAKLLRPRATAAAFTRLGVPRPRLVALAVAGFELLTAGLLLLRPALGGGAALVLLAAFSLFVADRLRRGAVAPCGCFGGSAAAPLSHAALVRNGLLGLLAAAAMSAPASHVPSLPDVLVVGAAAAAGLVVHALVELRVETGRLWDNRLETGPEATI